MISSAIEELEGIQLTEWNKRLKTKSKKGFTICCISPDSRIAGGNNIYIKNNNVFDVNKGSLDNYYISCDIDVNPFTLPKTYSLFVSLILKK